MNLFLIGWSFKKTPIEIRDKIALNDNQVIELGFYLKKIIGYKEIVIISTCNRTEIYSIDCKVSLKEILENLKKHWDTPEISETYYHFKDLAAVKHLYKVASSLDSMIIGEPQILGQIKNNFNFFLKAKLCGSSLNSIFTRAFKTAKRVRSETNIGQNSVSISYAAVELAKKFLVT